MPLHLCSTSTLPEEMASSRSLQVGIVLTSLSAVERFVIGTASLVAHGGSLPDVQGSSGIDSKCAWRQNRDSPGYIFGGWGVGGGWVGLGAWWPGVEGNPQMIFKMPVPWSVQPNLTGNDDRSLRARGWGLRALTF